MTPYDQDDELWNFGPDRTTYTVAPDIHYAQQALEAAAMRWADRIDRQPLDVNLTAEEAVLYAAVADLRDRLNNQEQF